MSDAMSSVAQPASSPPKARTGMRNARLLLPALLLLGVFFVLPVLSLLLRSVLEPVAGLQNYVQLLGSTTYLRVFGNTFLVASVVTVVTVAVGFPTAWLLAIAPRVISKLIFAILLLSMWTNLLARTFAWMVLLQQTGPINRMLMALGYFVTPALLGGPSYMMLAELIAQLVQELLNWGLAGAAAFVLLVVTLALYAVQLRFSRGAQTAFGDH
jgi:putative spermidine/putrescine transport system permease protein